MRTKPDRRRYSPRTRRDGSPSTSRGCRSYLGGRRLSGWKKPRAPIFLLALTTSIQPHVTLPRGYLMRPGFRPAAQERILATRCRQHRPSTDLGPVPTRHTSRSFYTAPISTRRAAVSMHRFSSPRRGASAGIVLNLAGGDRRHHERRALLAFRSPRLRPGHLVLSLSQSFRPGQ